eukprot:scaffold304531_cov39-Tisochrysis_lutea.AAC.1
MRAERAKRRSCELRDPAGRSAWRRGPLHSYISSPFLCFFSARACLFGHPEFRIMERRDVLLLPCARVPPCVSVGCRSR